MKRTVLPLVLMATSFLTGVANAQTSSSTPVIGYYKQTIPPGNTPVVCGFTTKKEFQGAMTSHAPGAPNSVITQTGAGWTVNQFQTSANPAVDSSHFIEILSGPAASVGMIYDIVSNTATTVTVEGSTTPLTGAITYCIRKHVTLGTLLPGGGGLTNGSDSISVVNPNASISNYVFNGLYWEDSGSGDDSSNRVIYPGQGFIIGRGGATPATITIGGNEVSYVKSGVTKIPLYYHAGNPYRNFVGLINPLVSDTAGTDFNTLGNFGLVAGLVAGSDLINIITTSGNFKTSATLTSNGLYLEDVGSGDDGSNIQIRNGTSFRIITTADRVITIPQTHPN
ncbi:MAG TPA: hypothetical protein VHM91_20325 [Verrucomicrobiales bacterium]|nr:hypothetical protein [Verrucomicrobiales bacterium]